MIENGFAEDDLDGEIFDYEGGASKKSKRKGKTVRVKDYVSNVTVCCDGFETNQKKYAKLRKPDETKRKIISPARLRKYFKKYKAFNLSPKAMELLSMYIEYILRLVIESSFHHVNISRDTAGGKSDKKKRLTAFAIRRCVVCDEEFRKLLQIIV